MEIAIERKKLTYSVEEAATASGISKSKMYEVIKMEGFPVIMLGGRRLVPIKGLERWIEEQTAHVGQ